MRLRLQAILMMILFLQTKTVSAQTGVFEVVKSTTNFTSDATSELINASSSGLKGVIDPLKKIFLFKIPIVSFTGFNTPLQQEHFNENYMESGHYPQAEFKGKIIEDVDLFREGTYTIRAKGSMIIHGVEQACIIRVTIKVKKKSIVISSSFPIALADYNIKIPRIVNDKLNPQIMVNVDAILTYKANRL